MKITDIENEIVSNPWRAVGLALLAGGLLGFAHRRGGLIGGAIAALMIRGAKHYAFGEFAEQAKSWIANAQGGPGGAERGASHVPSTSSFFRH